MVDSVCVVAGVPRSGTSWLGMLIDSCPVVNYRFQPFFSYTFKDVVHVDSTREDYLALFDAMDRTETEFLTQADKRTSGLYPSFEKQHPTTCLAFKTCRYQYLIPRMLGLIPHLKIVGIVRHPCGAIHSWLTNPKEFPAGSNVAKEWRFGACKNQGREEEFFGYYKWKEVAHLYLDLQQKYPHRVQVVRYEELVTNTMEQSRAIFELLDLPWTKQTVGFVNDCHARHDTSPYAVFKDPAVADRWRSELDGTIQTAIQDDLQGTRLERFLQ